MTDPYVAPAAGDVVRVYAAVSNTDLNSGMGGEKIIGYFWGYDEAHRFGRWKGVQGGDCQVVERPAVIDRHLGVWVDGRETAVGGSFDAAVAREKAREKLAAAGLTEGEYVLLGIPLHARPRRAA